MNDNNTQTDINKQVLDKPNGLSDAYRAVADAARISTSISAFYRQVLQQVAAIFACPYAEIYVRLPAEIVEDYHHSGSTDPGFWKPLVQRFLNESLTDGYSKVRLFKSKLSGADISIALLSAPISHAGGSSIGALVLVAHSDNREQARAYLTVLESIAHLISYCAEYVGTTQEDRASAQSVSGKHLSRVAGYSSRYELAFAVANNLRNKTSCDQVILGLVNRKKVKIIAISGHDEVQKRSPDVAKIREAMEECLDMNVPIVYQQEGAHDKTVTAEYRLHRQWHESAGHEAVASIPLHTEAKCTAIVSLKRHNAKPFTKDELQKIRELTEPYTAAFELVDRAHRSLPAHAANSCRNAAWSLVKPQGWVKKALLLFMIAFTGWFIFGSMNYQITVAGTVVPEKVRHFAVPLGGVLKSAAAVQGDPVKAGDILCVFDHDELLMEREKLRAQLQMAQLENDNATSKGLYFEAQLAQTNKKLAEAQLDIVNHKIEQSVVRAPFDGIIIRGDLRQRIGEILPQGEPIYEVACRQGWLLELEVPENLSADLQTNLEGKFSTNAKPELSHQLRLGRINPKTELNKTRNVYIAEAQVEMNLPWVMTGMEGVAKIQVGRRPVWWIALHRIINYIHLNT